MHVCAHYFSLEDPALVLLQTGSSCGQTTFSGRCCCLSDGRSFLQPHKNSRPSSALMGSTQDKLSSALHWSHFVSGICTSLLQSKLTLSEQRRAASGRVTSLLVLRCWSRHLSVTLSVIVYLFKKPCSVLKFFHPDSRGPQSSFQQETSQFPVKEQRLG